MGASGITVAVFSLVFSVLTVIFLIGLIKYFNQSNSVYKPTRQIIATPIDIGLDFIEVKLETDDGSEIYGWHIENTGDTDIVLIFHGNGGNISTRLRFISLFYKLGLSVFIIDYRGYGKSGGKPSEIGTYKDSDAAWDYLTGPLNIDPGKIVVLGRSLGGPIAARLASLRKPKALILDSTFTSLRDIASELYPYLPVKRFLRFKYDTLGFLEKTTVPILIIHSLEDDYIKIEHAHRIHSFLNAKSKLVEIEGSHGNSYDVSKKIYSEEVKKFLEEI